MATLKINRTLTLTDAAIQAAKPGDKEYYLRDVTHKGLVLRVYPISKRHPGGRKVFIADRRLRDGSGSRIKVELHDYDPATGRGLKEAREKFRNLLDEISKGIDPRNKAKQKTVATFEDLLLSCDIAVTLGTIRRPMKPQTWSGYKAVLDTLDSFKPKAITDITRHDIRTILVEKAYGSKLAEQVTSGQLKGALPPASAQANRTLSALNKVFTFAIDEGYLDISPCHLIPAFQARPGKKVVLSDSELNSVWHAMQSTECLPSTKHGYLMLICTLQRSVAVRHMRWQDIEWDWWTVPGKFMKRPLKHEDKAHRVFLAPTAKELIELMRPVTGSCVYVFAGKGGENTLNKWVWSNSNANKYMRKRLTAMKASVQDFTAHKFRGTVITKMQERRMCSRDDAKRLLSHIDGGTLAKHYSEYEYDHEIKQALLHWDRELRRIVGLPELTYPDLEERTKQKQPGLNKDEQKQLADLLAKLNAA